MQGKKGCDADKVRSIFNMEYVNAILLTRILLNCSKDMLAWVHSCDGQYIVKT